MSRSIRCGRRTDALKTVPVYRFIRRGCQYRLARGLNPAGCRQKAGPHLSPIAEFQDTASTTLYLNMTPIRTRLNVETPLRQFVARLPRLLSAIVVLIV